MGDNSHALKLLTDRPEAPVRDRGLYPTYKVEDFKEFLLPRLECKVFDLASGGKPYRRFPSHRVGYFRAQEAFRYNFQIPLANEGGGQVNVKNGKTEGSVAQVLFTSVLSGTPQLNKDGSYELPHHHLIVQVASKGTMALEEKVELPAHKGTVFEMSLDSLKLKLECSKAVDTYEVSERAAGRGLAPRWPAD